MTNGHLKPWLIEALKLSIPAAIALVAMYVQVELLKERTAANLSRIVSLEGVVATRGELIQANRSSIVQLEVRLSSQENKTAESLKRIEDWLREIRADVKDLQRK